MKGKDSHKVRFCDVPYKKARRERIESELAAIPKIDHALRKLISADGFADYYLEMQDLYSSQREAYERLEDIRIGLTGRRYYSGYGSFRRVLYRKQKKG